MTGAKPASEPSDLESFGTDTSLPSLNIAMDELLRRVRDLRVDVQDCLAHVQEVEE